MSEVDKYLSLVSKPARYTGGEWNSVVKEWNKARVRVALAYPDTYEIGSSNLAIPLLYGILNGQTDILAERVYAPWPDMEAILRQHRMPLFSLESKKPLAEFDIIGFSLSYELTYTNVLNMLDLSQIPVCSSERGDAYPLVIAGGSCALNPETMADFIDLFVLGDGEEVMLELVDLFRVKRTNKEAVLREAASIPGVYVPRFYQVSYAEDGTISSLKPNIPEASSVIRRRFVASLAPCVTNPVVPYLEVVHDRGAVEIQRGCSRGCRFCQAGVIYRPVRERPHQEVVESVGDLITNCGYNEIGLVSLSSGDYTGIDTLVSQLSDKYSSENLTVSLPSLRLDQRSIKLVEALPSRRKVTLTFAPEAGTERLRRAMNKDIAESTMIDTFTAVFERGWLNLKLYFMVGLPTETDGDIEGIVELVSRIHQLGRKVAKRPPRLRVSVSTFVPKPHSACQWAGQNTEVELAPKYEVLRQGLRRIGVQISWQDPKVSQLEAVLSRGDRRLSDVLFRVWQMGSKFDAWREHFNYENWSRAFEASGLSPAFYANRVRDTNEVLPWGHIDVGVTADFLRAEYERMSGNVGTVDCRRSACSACGIHRWHLACLDKFRAAKK